jgi:hypothetical protein
MSTDKLWPQRPDGVTYLSQDERKGLFGEFSYIADQDHPGEIEILGHWESKNIVKVPYPEFKRSVRFHTLVARQFMKFLEDLRRANLIDAIKAWDGSFSPRFVRGSKKNLSNHSWGTAFDINADWNQLGDEPALAGEEGSVRELVSIAVDNGFYWGGWGFAAEAYTGRLDGMHFEAFKIT